MHMGVEGTIQPITDGKRPQEQGERPECHGACSGSRLEQCRLRTRYEMNTKVKMEGCRRVTVALAGFRKAFYLRNSFSSHQEMISRCKIFFVRILTQSNLNFKLLLKV